MIAFQSLYYLQTLNTVDFSCFTNAYIKSSILYQVYQSLLRNLGFCFDFYLCVSPKKSSFS